MAYRDDYEAAIEQAATLERDLERARVEHAHDLERIAELEAQLAPARKRADAAKPASGKLPQVDRGGTKAGEPKWRARWFWSLFRRRFNALPC